MFWLETQNNPHLLSCQVQENQVLARDYYKLTINCPPIASDAEPGQFVMVYLPDLFRYYLPRPFSIFKADPKEGSIEILIRLIGFGTEVLSLVKPGQDLRLLGPLGNAFPQPCSGSLLVGGGLGIAPLVFLAANSGQPVKMVYGARTVSDMVCPVETLELPNIELIKVTDDGSCGLHGSVIDILETMLPETKAVYACGPELMLRGISSLCHNAGIKAWISVEEKMACGIGACRGCAVKTSSGYKRVCHDGPVFLSGEVFLND